MQESNQGTGSDQTESQFLDPDHPSLARLQEALNAKLDAMLESAKLEASVETQEAKRLAAHLENLGNVLFNQQDQLASLHAQLKVSTDRCAELEEAGKKLSENISSLESKVTSRRRELTEKEELANSLASERAALTRLDRRLREELKKCESEAVAEAMVAERLERGLLTMSKTAEGSEEKVSALKASLDTTQAEKEEIRLRLAAEEASAGELRALLAEMARVKADAKKEVVEVGSAIDATKTLLGKRQAALSVMLGESAEGWREIETTESVVADLEKTAESLKAQISLLSDKYNGLELTKAMLESQLVKQVQEASARVAELESRKSANSKASSELLAVQKQVKEAENKISEIRTATQKIGVVINERRREGLGLLHEAGANDKLVARHEKELQRVVSELETAGRSVVALENELATTEVSLADTVRKRGNLEISKTSLEALLDKANAELRDVKARVAKRETDISRTQSALQKLLASYEDKLEKAKSAGVASNSVSLSLGGKVRTLEAQRKEVDQTNLDRQAEFVKEQENIVALETAVADASREVSELNATKFVLTNKRDKLAVELKSINASVHKLEGELRRLRFTAQRTVAARNNFEQRLVKVQEETSNLSSIQETKLSEVRTSFEDSKKESDDLQASVSQLKQDIMQTEERVMACEREIALEEEFQQKMQSLGSESAGELDELRRRRTLLADQLTQLRTQIDKVSKLLALSIDKPTSALSAFLQEGSATSKQKAPTPRGAATRIAQSVSQEQEVAEKISFYEASTVKMTQELSKLKGEISQASAEIAEREKLKNQIRVLDGLYQRLAQPGADVSDVLKADLEEQKAAVLQVVNQLVEAYPEFADSSKVVFSETPVEEARKLIGQEPRAANTGTGLPPLTPSSAEK